MDKPVKASESRDSYQRWQMEANTCEPNIWSKWCEEYNIDKMYQTLTK